MNIKAVRRISARLLKCGEKRVWIDSSKYKEIKETVTTDDIRRLIKEKTIRKIKAKGVPRTKGRIRAKKKKKGRLKGYGKRKGTAKARIKKREWILRIRAQRKLLRKLKDSGLLKKGYREIYLKIKGGVFRDKAHLLTHLKSQNYLTEGEKSK